MSMIRIEKKFLILNIKQRVIILQIVNYLIEKITNQKEFLRKPSNN